MPHCCNTNTHTRGPQTHSEGGVTTASFDLLTLRLLKQALRQLFCKICLPRESRRERGRGGGRERVDAVLTLPE